MKELSKHIKEVRQTAGTTITILPLQNIVVGAWSDSALYGSSGELLADSDLEGYNKHNLHSQAGCLVGLLDGNELESMESVNVSFIDWRTRATKRVVHATFAAEAYAALEALGMGLYLRAYLCEVFWGHGRVSLEEYGEDQMKVILWTDCKSLYDHLRKDGSVPDDRWTALSVGSLRCGLSAGGGRNEQKAECRWLPSRWQLADCLTKTGLGKVMRERMQSASTRLHERPSQSLKRQALVKSKTRSLSCHIVDSADRNRSRTHRELPPRFRSLSVGTEVGRVFPRRKKKFDPRDADRNNPFAHPPPGDSRWENILGAVYRQHAPHLLENDGLRRIMSKYRGHEKKLHDAFLAKYRGCRKSIVRNSLLHDAQCRVCGERGHWGNECPARKPLGEEGIRDYLEAKQKRDRDREISAESDSHDVSTPAPQPLLKKHRAAPRQRQWKWNDNDAISEGQSPADAEHPSVDWG